MPAASPRSSLALVLAGALAVVSLAGCGSSSRAGTAASASASSSASSQPGIRVQRATVDLPANSEVGAVRMVVRNGGDRADDLLRVTSPIAGSAMVHRSIVDAAGRATMVSESSLPIAARSSVTFEPGGLHVMLTGITRPLQVGDEVPLTLTFRHAGTVRAIAVVVQPAQGGGDHEH